MWNGKWMSKLSYQCCQSRPKSKMKRWNKGRWCTSIGWEDLPNCLLRTDNGCRWPNDKASLSFPCSFWPPKAQHCQWHTRCKQASVPPKQIRPQATRVQLLRTLSSGQSFELLEPASKDEPSWASLSTWSSASINEGGSKWCNRLVYR